MVSSPLSHPVSFSYALILAELSSLLINMDKESQVIVAIPLRTAIWNWITTFPDDFNDAIRTRGRLEGKPERVVEALYQALGNNNEPNLWPTLVALESITADRISASFSVNHFGRPSQASRGQKVCVIITVSVGLYLIFDQANRLFDDISRHANTASRLSELALTCALDVCRAAAFVRPPGEIPLRMVATDIAHEVKVCVHCAHLYLRSQSQNFFFQNLNRTHF